MDSLTVSGLTRREEIKQSAIFEFGPSLQEAIDHFADAAGHKYFRSNSNVQQSHTYIHYKCNRAVTRRKKQDPQASHIIKPAEAQKLCAKWQRQKLGRSSTRPHSSDQGQKVNCATYPMPSPVHRRTIARLALGVLSHQHKKRVEGVVALLSTTARLR